MITFDQVSKIYSTGETVLEDISFRVHPGELVTITGPSGSGKTTLLRLMYKDLEPTKGTITVDSQDITRLKPKEIPAFRRKIGYAFQDFKIIPDRTVWENIALTLDIINLKENAITQRVKHLLDLVGLTPKAELFPGQLSGGELQRVSIARAMAHEPDILLADEPTGNLDSETSIKIAELFKQINNFGTTVLLATHDPEVLKYLKSRHIAIEKGKITHDSGSQKHESTSKKEDEKEDKEEEKKNDTTKTNFEDNSSSEEVNKKIKKKTK